MSTQKASSNMDDNPSMQLLIEGCNQLGLTLDQTQVTQFRQYYHELVAWNQKFNLTAITGYEDVQVRHFLDSLAGLPIYTSEIGVSAPPKNSAHAIDVGTGAGLPGIPLKIIWPQLQLTLLDGTGKKIRFLKHVVSQLKLQNVTCIQGRAEELGRDTAYRGQYDLVVARAVAPLSTLVEYLIPFARRDGYIMAYKGANVATEFMDARKAIETLGGETVRLAPVDVPTLDEGRFVLLIHKIQRTPSPYPRGQGLPRRRPIE